MVAMGRKLALAKAMVLNGSEEPQPGDLVVETTSMTLDPDAIGWLVGHDDAPYREDDPLDGSVPMREVWDVRPLSDRTQQGRDFQRWENAEFAKLPDSIAALVKEMNCVEF